MLNRAIIFIFLFSIGSSLWAQDIGRYLTKEAYYEIDSRNSIYVRFVVLAEIHTKGFQYRITLRNTVTSKIHSFNSEGLKRSYRNGYVVTGLCQLLDKSIDLRALNKDDLVLDIVVVGDQSKDFVFKSVIEEGLSEENSGMSLFPKVLISSIVPGLPVLFDSKAKMHPYLSILATYGGVGFVLFKYSQYSDVADKYETVDEEDPEYDEKREYFSNETQRYLPQAQYSTILPIAGWTAGMIFTVVNHFINDKASPNASNWKLKMDFETRVGYPTLGVVYVINSRK
jgi:hypothetical protein